MRFDFATSQHIPFSSQPSVETEEKEVEVEEEASVAVGKEDDAATALVWDASDEDFFDRAFAAAAAARLLHQQTSSAAVSFSSASLPPLATARRRVASPARSFAPALPAERRAFGGLPLSAVGRAAVLPGAEVMCLRTAFLLCGERVAAFTSPAVRATVQRNDMTRVTLALTSGKVVVVALPPPCTPSHPSPLVPVDSYYTSLALASQLRVGDRVLVGHAPSTEVIECAFGSGTLGLTLQYDEGVGVRVEEIDPTASAEAHRVLRVGDRLLRVGKRAFDPSTSLAAGVAFILAAKRPMVLAFRREVRKRASGAASSSAATKSAPPAAKRRRVGADDETKAGPLSSRPREAVVVRKPANCSFPIDAATAGSNDLFGSILVEWVDDAKEPSRERPRCSLVSPWDITSIAAAECADADDDGDDDDFPFLRRLAAHPAAKHFRRELDDAKALAGATATAVTLAQHLSSALVGAMRAARALSPRFLFAEALDVWLRGEVDAAAAAALVSWSIDGPREATL